MKKSNSTKTSESFIDHLKQKQLSYSSIKSYTAMLDRFLVWLKKQGMEPEQVHYADVLAYMKYCQQQGVAQRTIQSYLISVRNFYNHLVELHRVKTNPLQHVKVQGVKQKSLHKILEPHELHAIYHHYRHETLSGRKNKVIIGLLVYQGLKTEELDKLEVKDVKLKEGKIEIPGGRKGNSRTLQLESHQVLDMYDYVKQTRPQILEQTKKKTERLFVSLEDGVKLRIDYLVDQLRKQSRLPSGAKITSVKQIRASVIVKWLKQYNLREVQYLAGHRYISSTEAYQQSEMQGLSEEVNQFHPLG
jgi:site-specific recombinase XerD